ncbi:hypothetical protein GCM10027074_19180 [Streptomyces deserti]
MISGTLRRMPFGTTASRTRSVGCRQPVLAGRAGAPAVLMGALGCVDLAGVLRQDPQLPGVPSVPVA